MKKSILIFISCILFATCISAQSHAWQWAETCAQPDNASDGATYVGITTDVQGNVLVTGYFYNGSVTLGGHTLYNTDPGGNTSDIYTAKYDPQGNVMWAKSGGGNSFDDAYQIVTDKGGNAYITGYFLSDSIVFGDIVLHNHTTGDTFADIFVVKYNPAGTLLWAKCFGGDNYDVGQSIAADAEGNFYLTGNNQSDSILFGTTALYNNSDIENAFLVKCDSNGNVLWATGSSSSLVVASYGVAVDPWGNPIIAGRFDGPTANFGSQKVVNSRTGYDDIYLARFDASGNALWMQGAGGSLNDEALGIATDAQGNAFITGYFNSETANFSGQQLTNNISDGTSDIFTAKYDSSGNLQWVNNGSGGGNDVSQAIATDTSGNVYITGYYYSPTLIFGNDTLNNFDPQVNTDDAFVVEYNAAGNLVNALSQGNISYDCGNRITTDISENVYVVGFFRSDDIVFGDTTLYSGAPNHYLNPFLARYSCVAPVTPVITQLNDTLQSSIAFNNQWYLNGAAIPGATGQIYVAVQAGTYSVAVVNGPTCSATSQGVTTGLNNPLQLPAISLYPNPASNLLMVESESFSAEHVTALMYDVTGKIVPAPYTKEANRINFDVSNLSAGMYWLKVNINCQQLVAKFVKASSVF